jgi:phosphoribosylpyrophosphate synthetase
MIFHLQRFFLFFLFLLLNLLAVCETFRFVNPFSSIISSLRNTFKGNFSQIYEKEICVASVSKRKYHILAAPSMETMAKDMVNLYPDRFSYYETKWNKFPDGTDNIQIGGFQPRNQISNQDVLFLASFHNNDITLSQFSVMITLLQSFINSLTVVLPFYPVGTMERIIEEGKVATANTYAQLFSHLPSCGKPTRLMVYDLHTLQNRFYLHGNTLPSLQTSIPLLIDHLQKQKNTVDEKQKKTKIDCIAFPDDGAAKRFQSCFENSKDYEIIICGKTRSLEDKNKRKVVIQEGFPQGKNILVIDDLVQSGSTLYECGMTLKRNGAKEISTFVVHGVFPNGSWRKFLPDGEYGDCFEKFYVTNSIPSMVSQLPKGTVFEVLDLKEKIIEDLDRFC